MHDKDKSWIYLSVISGFVCGLGNYFMGVELAQAGMMGPGFTGPLALVSLGGYRLCHLIRNKAKTGCWIDYSTSNWFTPQHKFKRYNLMPLAGNFIPNLLGLVLLSFGFKYAALGELN